MQADKTASSGDATDENTDAMELKIHDNKPYT